MYSQINVLYPMMAFEGGSAVPSQSTTVSTASITPTGYTTDNRGGGVALVMFDIQTSNVRVRVDGVAPTSTVGHILYAGTNYTWNVQLYNAAKFIRDSSGSVDAVIFATPVSN